MQEWILSNLSDNSAVWLETRIFSPTREAYEQLLWWTARKMPRWLSYRIVVVSWVRACGSDKGPNDVGFNEVTDAARAGNVRGY